MKGTIIFSRVKNCFWTFFSVHEIEMKMHPYDWFCGPGSYLSKHYFCICNCRLNAFNVSLNTYMPLQMKLLCFLCKSENCFWTFFFQCMKLKWRCILWLTIKAFKYPEDVSKDEFKWMTSWLIRDWDNSKYPIRIIKAFVWQFNETITTE